jgi:hypothetical protein
MMRCTRGKTILKRPESGDDDDRTVYLNKSVAVQTLPAIALQGDSR